MNYKFAINSTYTSLDKNYKFAINSKYSDTSTVVLQLLSTFQAKA